MMGITYSKAIENAEAMKAIGQTSIYLSEYDENPDNFPWELVSEVSAGSLHSYLGPRSVALSVKHPTGLEFHWSVDFSPDKSTVEKRPFFDHARLVALADRLPNPARLQFAGYLAKDVLPPLTKQITEARAHLSALLEGETTLHGIIVKATA